MERKVSYCGHSIVEKAFSLVMYSTPFSSIGYVFAGVKIGSYRFIIKLGHIRPT